MDRSERQKRRDDIAKMIAQGKTPYDISKKYSVCLGTIYSVAKTNGLRISPTDGSSRGSIGDTAYRVIAALLRGEKQSKIAKDNGVSKQRVYQIKEKAHRFGILGQSK